MELCDGGPKGSDDGVIFENGCSMCGIVGVPLFHEQTGNVNEPRFCGRECQLVLHLVGRRSHSRNPNIPYHPKAFSLEFRKRGFYKESAKRLQWIRKNDIFTYLALSHYGQQSIINVFLYRARGNLNKLKNYYSLMPTFARLMNPSDPYGIWDQFYATLLQTAPQLGKPFTNKSGTVVITTKQRLLYHYPELIPKLKMRDVNKFVIQYVSAIQNAILGTAVSKSPIKAFRGYGAMNIPGSLTLDPKAYKEGQVVTNWGFMSVSLDQQIASGFAKPAERCCMMQIVIPSGFPAFMLTSDRDDESFPQIPTAWTQMELLLPIGTVVRLGRILGKRPYKTFFVHGGGGEKTVLLTTIAATVIGIKQPIGMIPPPVKTTWDLKKKEERKRGM